MHKLFYAKIERKKILNNGDFIGGLLLINKIGQIDFITKINLTDKIGKLSQNNIFLKKIYFMFPSLFTIKKSLINTYPHPPKIAKNIQTANINNLLGDAALNGTVAGSITV